MSEVSTFDKLIKLRGRDFLAKTGDKKSIIALLEGICDDNTDVSQYALEAVFNNPLAYQELMDLNSIHRIKVIHHFSENDLQKAIQFSLDSLHSEDSNIKLLALDVLDYNIAYLNADLQFTLKNLIKDAQERVRVKASRLLILLSDYEDISLGDCEPISIIEAAMESDDLVCRQMAFGIPSSVFYKLKQVKTTIEDLHTQIDVQAKAVQSLNAEVIAFQANLSIKDKTIEKYQQAYQEAKNKHQRLSQKYSQLKTNLSDKEQAINEHLSKLEQINQELHATQASKETEKKQAKQNFETLIHDYKQREDQFKQGFNDVFAKAQHKIHELAQQKQHLLKQLKDLQQENLRLKESLSSKQLSRT